LQLPVIVVLHSGHDGSASGRATNEKAVEVRPCSAFGGMAPTDGRDDQPASGMLIVRPE
jgi:hypothetical protein